MELSSLYYLIKAVANPVKLPASSTKMWLDYDAGADVVFLHFDPSPNSTHSEMSTDGIILDYQDDKLVGLTILEASK